MPVYVYSKRELAKYRAKQIELAAKREQEYQASFARDLTSPARPAMQQHNRNAAPLDDRNYQYPQFRAPPPPSYNQPQPYYQQHQAPYQQPPPLHQQRLQSVPVAAGFDGKHVKPPSAPRVDSNRSFAQYYGPNITTPERWVPPPPPSQQARYIPPSSAWPVRYRQQLQPYPHPLRSQSQSEHHPDAGLMHAQPAPIYRGDVGGRFDGFHNIAPPGNTDLNQSARAAQPSSQAQHYSRHFSMQQHPTDTAHVHMRARSSTGIHTARSPSPSEQPRMVVTAGVQRRASTLSSVSPAVVHSEYRRPVHQQLFSDMPPAADPIGLQSPCPPPAPSRGDSGIHEPIAGRPYVGSSLDNSNSRMDLQTMRSSNRASGSALSRSGSVELFNEVSNLRSKLSLATAKITSLELRVPQLESSLQHERDAYQTLMLQHQRLQGDYDKQFAEQRQTAALEEHKTAQNVVICSIPEEKAVDLTKELEKARAEAAHFRAEHDKVVLSSSNLAAKVSHASSDVQNMMEQQANRFEEQRKKDLHQIELLKNQKDSIQDRMNFLQSELDGFRESLVNSRESRSRATPPQPQKSSPQGVFIGRSIDLDESSRFVRQVALQQLHNFSNLPGFVGVGIRVKEILDGGINRTIITEMLPNMSANDSGAINVGDSLLAIDTKSVTGLSLEQIRDLTVGPRGTLVSLLLSRNGRHFTASFDAVAYCLSLMYLLQVFLRRGSFSCAHCTVSDEDLDRSIRVVAVLLQLHLCLPMSLQIRMLVLST